MNHDDLEASDTAGASAFDLPRIERAVREILLALGEDPDREGLRRTPRRVSEAYAELFAGLREDPRAHLGVTFDEGHKELVVLRDIPFASLCEHHLLPFTGRAHVGYIPEGRVVGLSKLARLVNRRLVHSRTVSFDRQSLPHCITSRRRAGPYNATT